jgi:tripartite-type tricarboxylate transporter receptor subunit TctC
LSLRKAPRPSSSISCSVKVAKILADPVIKAKADAAGLFPVTTTSAEFATFIRKEAERWGPVVKESGIRYD